MVLKTRFELRAQSSTKAHSWPACAASTSRSSSIALGSRRSAMVSLITLQEVIETPRGKIWKSSVGKIRIWKTARAYREDDRCLESQPSEQLLANGDLQYEVVPTRHHAVT